MAANDSYKLAKEKYSGIGVDTVKVIERLGNV